MVCANVLSLFYKNGRGHELPETLDWLENVLKNRAYISGTYYYNSADQFLFFLSRLLQNSSEVRQRLGPMLKDRITERFGSGADALSLAARIIAASVVEIVDDRDLETLLSMQSEDGSWNNGWFYKYGASGVLIRNDGFTTALAIQAIQQVEKLRKIQSKPTAILTTPSSLPSTAFAVYLSDFGRLLISGESDGGAVAKKLNGYRHYKVISILQAIYAFFGFLAIIMLFQLFFF